MTRPLLTVAHLTAGYGGGTVLQGVDLSIEEASIVGMIGRNGMGKTTFVKALIGLLPVEGSIRYDGVELVGLPAHRRARLGIGYVPQGRGLFPQMTVAENVATGARVRTGARPGLRETVEALFPIVSTRRTQIARTLSGGEQQQVAIARALLGNPRLLLLDEPSEGIQPSIVRSIGEALVEVNRRFGTTILLIEQSIELVAATVGACHRIEKGALDVIPPEDGVFHRDRLARLLDLN